MVTTIMTLWQRYRNKTKVAELTGHDWKTVAKVIKMVEGGGQYPVKKPHPRILDSYRQQILEWMDEGLNGVRIFENLRSIGVKVG